MGAERFLNGLDIGAVEGTIRAIKGDPSLARCEFRAKNDWLDGGYNRSTVNGFYGAGQENVRSAPFLLEADEPLVLAGRDPAANPVELLLHALAACLTTTMVYHASLRGIAIDAIESEITGDLDLRGFLGISDKVRTGYERIRINFKVRTGAENLEMLKELARFSPVYNVVSDGTRVEMEIERLETPARSRHERERRPQPGAQAT